MTHGSPPTALADAIEQIAAGLGALAVALRGATPATADAWLPLFVAARELGVRPRVLSDAARRGELTLGGAGRSRVVSRAELDRWIASRATRTATATSEPDAVDAAIARAARRAAR
jgi:hypothetical protein